MISVTRCGGGILLALLSMTLLTACGGGEQTPSRTAASSMSPSTATAVSQASPGSTAVSQLTLAITSISPSPAKSGERITIMFKTQPAALIGLQITDANGRIVTQSMVVAGSDGTAIFQDTLKGPPGKWLVEAAAGLGITDLLRLQASPTSGPETADSPFEVQ